jgi:hypothetical protein
MKKVTKLMLAWLLVATTVLALMPNEPAPDATEDSLIISLTPTGTLSINVKPDTWAPEIAVGTGGVNSATKIGKIWSNGTVYCTVDVSAAFGGGDVWTLNANATGTAHNKAVLCINDTSLDAPAVDQFSMTGGGDMEPFWLYVGMPTSSSVNAVQTLTVTFTGTAS